MPLIGLVFTTSLASCCLFVSVSTISVWIAKQSRFYANSFGPPQRLSHWSKCWGQVHFCNRARKMISVLQCTWQNLSTMYCCEDAVQSERHPSSKAFEILQLHSFVVVDGTPKVIGWWALLSRTFYSWFSVYNASSSIVYHSIVSSRK